MNTFSHVPPGFRFHPTDEELVDYYLRKKVAARKIDLDVIKDVDLYKIEPWDLQGSEEQQEWYFFSHKDKKYPTGTRTNRATKAGFWKATGRDKAIYTKHYCLIGMRKTLVFYKGRAPNGHKSDWIMHEYRLETNENATPQEEGWVVCRVFKKRMATTMRKLDDSPCWYDDQVSFMDSPTTRIMPHHHHYHSLNNNNNNDTTTNNFNPQQNHQIYNCKQELEIVPYNIDPFLQLPQLESPKMPNPNNHHIQNCTPNNIPPYPTHQGHLIHSQPSDSIYSEQIGVMDHVTTDWRMLDNFVANQLSHDIHHHGHFNKGSNYTKSNVFHVSEDMSVAINPDSNSQHLGMMTSDQYASTSNSSCQIDDMWN